MSLIDRIKWKFNPKIKFGKNVHIEPGTRIVPPFKLEFAPGKNYRQMVKHCGELIIGDGSWIGANCTIQVGVFRPTVIGKHVWVDHDVHIAHDDILNDFVCLPSGTTLGGEVEIGEHSYLGIDCSVKPAVKIGKRTLIGMGSLVNKDIPDGVIAYGSPCKVIRQNEWYPPTLV
jgi:acetyltransferase-like isoleucine patch superfamily enzyme